MRSWKVIFAESLYAEMHKYLFSNSPNENGCFLLANHYNAGRYNSVLIVTKIIRPDPNNWQYADDSSLAPTSEFINRAVIEADSSGLCPLFVHTHPGPHHPLSFSSVDRSTNVRLFQNLDEILSPRPLGSIVISSEGVSGVVFSNGRLEDITQVKVIGSSLKAVHLQRLNSASNILDSKFDRQVRMYGEKNQELIQSLTVSIVGLGGTGSSVAIQLARMGVRKLLLIDKDTIEDTNLTRVYGSTIADIGRPKVEVIKKHIRSFSRDTKVKTLRRDVTKEDVTDELIQSDIIFGCTDNLSSRAIMNDVAIQYYIPLIDIGCRIHKLPDGRIDQMLAKIQVVTPDTACLWCTETLDGVAIMQETLTDNERKKLELEGYGENTDKQPSIISLTSMAASLGVHKFLQMLTDPTIESTTQVELVNSFFINDSPKIKQECVCQKRRGVAGLRRII
ncbi:MAG: ThiF family adenylyltransferase [Thermoplasmatales archaeon]